jgi:hypothetical protein
MRDGVAAGLGRLGVPARLGANLLTISGERGGARRL